MSVKLMAGISEAQLPHHVREWAQQTLPDGEYVVQYTICDDQFYFRQRFKPGVYGETFEYRQA